MTNPRVGQENRKVSFCPLWRASVVVIALQQGAKTWSAWFVPSKAQGQMWGSEADSRRNGGQQEPSPPCPRRRSQIGAEGRRSRAATARVISEQRAGPGTPLPTPGGPETTGRRPGRGAGRSLLAGAERVTAAAGDPPGDPDPATASAGPRPCHTGPGDPQSSMSPRPPAWPPTAPQQPPASSAPRTPACEVYEEARTPRPAPPSPGNTGGCAGPEYWRKRVSAALTVIVVLLHGADAGL
jgi:hypothetical protein